MLKVKNLSVSIDENKLVENVNLEFEPNKIYAIVGPNGAGKSSLINGIINNPRLKVEGDTFLDEKNITKLTIDKRSLAGIYVSWQNPVTIHGVNYLEFLEQILIAKTGKKPKILEFYNKVNQITKELGFNFDLLKRNINEDFSGGERKKGEILQIYFLKPNYIFLDEIDSGIDNDSLILITDFLKKYFEQEKNVSLILVSHYQKIFKILKPNIVYVVLNGQVVEKSDPTILDRIENDGYQWLFKKHNLTPRYNLSKDENKFLGICGAKTRK
ncbi:Fe-S cluster assembly ATPase SufC [Mycoplasma sp. SG1]|uniref:Fe-S cluster assembly ATPase SufC n=1 Tax=Mycoplasma sp. SG1 TaxID=2810348 RepID=UPI002024B9AC|nr:Fe-S cluster assembly ATPase SufC [Mycoplasma sp. SG1]URM52836.1 Fe-S cluster assembly ATPase SufC [Mycoplasma sp. SG1]